MTVEKPKPWQKEEHLANYIEPGVYYRVEYYADDHLLHRNTDEGIAWCGRPLVFEDLRFFRLNKKQELEKLDHRVYISTRTSANARCAECRRAEKAFFADLDELTKMRKKSKYAKW